ncbi:MAG: 23S rRNA (guanosine(2251)-2'-O)-methyltransferase RlmB [Wenzhouxiangellaceae bacterium]
MNSLQLAGPQVVETVLAAKPQQFSRIWLQQDSKSQRLQALEKSARKAGIEVTTVDRERLDKMMPGVRHQGIIADFTPDNVHSEEVLDELLASATSDPLFLILDGVQDPHNLGACLRSAEAAGVTAVILPKDRAAELTAVARRAAVGAAELVPIVRVVNLARVLRQLKAAGVWLAGTSDDASATLYQQDLRGPLGLVLGGEGDGMRRLTSEICDYQLAIPLHGHVSSLNVSVAAGVCLFEIQRQRLG